MSKLNQLEQELKAIDPGKFQKLGDLYLSRQPRYTDLRAPGSVLGADKTAPGVPDSIIGLPEGGYAFVAYTTEAEHAKLVAKLHKDLADSLDENKTGVPAREIHEVILCHSGRLEADEVHALIDEGRQRNCVVHIKDRQEIARYLFRDPGLAKDQLGVSIDTGQILRPVDWIQRYQRSSFSTRLDTTFHFREKELQQAVEALDRCDLLLVGGEPGVGKSRLMLEAGARFAAGHPTYEQWSIYNRGVNIFEDVQIYFSGDGYYIVLIDDANRLNATLDYFLQLLCEQRDTRHIKIIATVREYALANVRAFLHRAGVGAYEETRVERLTDGQIRTLVADETTVKNQAYLDRISHLAQGNPRLAMMAAAIAVRANTLESIGNAEALYDEYFRSIDDDLGLLANARMLEVAGIVAFLRVVDRSNEVQMSLIQAAFNVGQEEFWPIAEELHDREILDMYDNQVVRFSDQVRATYLFYQAVFRRKLVPVAGIFAFFFPQHRALIVDALNPAIDAFGPPLLDELRPEADTLWAAAAASGDHQRTEELMRLFWFLKQTETLRYIRDYIAALEVEAMDITKLDFNKSTSSGEFPLGILAKFAMPDKVAIAVALICDYAAKRPSALSSVLHVFCDDLGYRPRSYESDYALQRSILNVLWERIEGESDRQAFFARLYLGVALAFLRVQHHFSEPGGRMTINVITFALPRTPALTALRREIFEHVRALFAVAALRAPVLDLLDRYASGAALMAATETIAEDSQQLLPFIAETFNPDSAQESEVAHKYFRFLRRTNIDIPAAVQAHFDTPSAALRHLLAPDFSDYPGTSFEEFQAGQHERLAAHCQAFTVTEYREFFLQAASVQPDRGGHGRWEFAESIGYVFEELGRRDPALFVDVVTMYLNLGNPLQIGGYGVLHRLVPHMGAAASERLLRGREFQGKEQWLFAFYAYIPEEEITPAHAENLLALYRTAPAEQIPGDFRYLERYRRTSPGAFAAIVAILLQRREESFFFGRLLHYLFMPNMMTADLLLSSFSGSDLGLLKSAYFAAEDADPHMDHDGSAFNAILDLDRHFLREALQRTFHMNQAKEKRWLGEYADERQYDFLWRRDDYEERLREVLQELFALATGDPPVFLSGYQNVFFGLRHLSLSTDPLLLARRLPLLRTLVRERSRDREFMRLLFEIASYLPHSESQELIATFLENNQQPEDFQHLTLLPSHHTWTGSAVPMIQREIEFLESLLPLTNTVALLEQRAYLEERIAEMRRSAEREKKSDFLRDL